jgi:hypothetical protein
VVAPGTLKPRGVRGFDRIVERSRKVALVTHNYEYKFVRLGEGFFAARKVAKQTYQDVIQQHAREGWRLVQVFAPGTGAYGAAKYYEIILERPR